MTTQLERAADALFPSEGTGHVLNIKFMLGNRRGVKAEQLAEQYNRAEAQIRAHETAPVTGIDDDLTC